MARLGMLVVAVAVIVAGCERSPQLPYTSAEAERLQWLDQTDVQADFRDHVERQHDTRFVSVYALSFAGEFGISVHRKRKGSLESTAPGTSQGPLKLLVALSICAFVEKHPNTPTNTIPFCCAIFAITQTPNPSMKPTIPSRNAFSVLLTAPCRGLSLSRQMVST